MRQEVEQALAELKNGQVETAIRLLERTVLSFGMKVCGHREDAEDTAQEVLLKLLPHVSKFDNPKAFSVWLYTVARNRCLMSRRQSKFAPKEHLALHELMPSDEELASLMSKSSTTPESEVLRNEHAENVRAALQKVPAHYRLVLVLHDMEGLDTSEVANVMRLREGTVRVRLHRARLALRKELANRELPISRTLSRARHSHKPRNCREIFAALSDYLDNAVDPKMCERLEKHISGCTPCEAFLADLERAVERCRSFEPNCDSGHKRKLTKALKDKYARVLRSLEMETPSS